MATVLPGTTIEVSAITHGLSAQLFDGIFAVGGITLSQAAIMTGLEPHVIQNWVKRGFVSPPQNRSYSREQFARIVLINLLRETFQIDRVCRVLPPFGGIGNATLYHRFTDMVACAGERVADDAAIEQAARYIVGGSDDPANVRQMQLLRMLAYAHNAYLSRRAAEELLMQL